MISCKKEKQDYNKGILSIALCKNNLICFSPWDWITEKVVRSRTSSTARKNERNIYSQKWGVTWLLCGSPACMWMDCSLCNWITSGKSLFSVVDRIAAGTLRSAQNPIIHLFWWFWLTNDLDERLPVSSKNHDVYFRLAVFNFIWSYCV